jgi:hypothetical protein
LLAKQFLINFLFAYLGKNKAYFSKETNFGDKLKTSYSKGREALWELVSVRLLLENYTGVLERLKLNLLYCFFII